MQIYPANERFHTRLKWLDSCHSFSFGRHYNPQRLGVSFLRVINDDRVEGGGGFLPHRHEDMEIISYVVSGALAHKDSEGNEEVIQAGDVQLMRAGKGIQHSEYNASKTEPVHFLQIWIVPQETGLPPSYQQASWSENEKREAWCVLAAPEAYLQENSVQNKTLILAQNVLVLSSFLVKGQERHYTPKSGRQIWLQVVRGQITVNGHMASSGDGIHITAEAQINLKGILQESDAELLLFDLPI